MKHFSYFNLLVAWFYNDLLLHMNEQGKIIPWTVVPSTKTLAKTFHNIFNFDRQLLYSFSFLNMLNKIDKIINIIYSPSTSIRWIHLTQYYYFCPTLESKPLPRDMQFTILAEGCLFYIFYIFMGLVFIQMCGRKKKVFES